MIERVLLVRPFTEIARTIGRLACLLAPLLVIGACATPVEQTDPAEPAVPANLVEALGDRTAWQAVFVPSDERTADAWGRSVWEALAVEGFTYSKTEPFACGGQKHWIVIAVHAKTGLEFALLPGGEFLMGKPEEDEQADEREKPQRTVRVRPFLLARTEVTNRQYLEFQPHRSVRPSFFSVPSPEPSEEPRKPADDSSEKNSLGVDFDADCLPVARVSWIDASDWCAAVGLRLPSEAEWEYACRAGTTTDYFWGETAEDGAQYANMADQTARREWPERILKVFALFPTIEYFAEMDDGQAWPAPVGSFLPNAFGLFEIVGNVREWCQDAWHENYQGAPGDGSPRTGESHFRPARGGSWGQAQCYARSGDRDRRTKELRDDFTGFRPAGPSL